MLRRRTAGNNGREQNKAQKQTNRAAQLSTKRQTNRSCWQQLHGRAAAVGFSATHRAADSKRVGAPQWCRRHTQGGIISRIQIHWGGVLWANNSSSSSVKVQRYIGAWHLPSWHQCQLLFPSKSKLPGLWKGRLQFSAHTNLGPRRQTKGWNQFIPV